MHELYRVGAFADARGHPLDRAESYIAGDENSRDTRLQQPRLAFQWPTLRRLSGVYQIRAREDETLVVSLYRAVQPFGGWRGTDKNEQRNRRNPLCFSTG